MNIDWAIVLGGAECVWDDVARFEQLYGRRWDGQFIAVNDIGCHWPRQLHHWVSLHPNRFKKWKYLRERTVNVANLDSIPPTTWGRPPRFDEERQYYDRVSYERWMGGSSGLFAVQVAQELRCTRVILCGVPMTVTPHFIQSQEEGHAAPWGSADNLWRGWKNHAHLMRGWVRSMSGRTGELLGTPTIDWLANDAPYMFTLAARCSF